MTTTTHQHFTNPNIAEQQIATQTNAFYIPAGKYIDIDERYYMPSLHSMDARGNHHIRPPQETINRDSSGFVQKSVFFNPLKSNYGSYFHQPQTGTDALHHDQTKETMEAYSFF